MKKIAISMIFSAIVAVAITELCIGTPTPKPNKIFIGEWERIDKPDDDMVIQREGDATVIVRGTDKYAAVYDKAKKALKIYFMSQTAMIKYVEKTDHLVFNNGQDGEYKRVN